MKQYLYLMLTALTFVHGAHELNGCTPGAITAVGSPINLPLTSEPSAVAYSPDARFLAVANQGDNNVAIFSVASTGILTEISGSPYATGVEPLALSYSTDGRCLTVANYADNTLTLFSVDATTGALTVIDSAFPVGTNPRAVAYDRSNHLAVALESDNQVAVYLRLANCNLSLIGTYPSGTTPTAISYSTTGFLAVVNRGDNSLSVFGANNLGELTLVATYLTGTNPSDVVYSGTGLLAVSNQDDNTVSMYNVDSTGELTIIGSYATENAPYGVSFSPDASNLLVTNLSGNFSIYTVDSNGFLTLLNTQYLAITPLGAGRYAPIGNFFAIPSIFEGSVYPYTYTQKPVGTISANKTLILPGNKVTLTANMTQGRAPFTLEWQFAFFDANSQSTVQSYVEFNVTDLNDQIIIDPTVNTSVSLRITDTVGCTSTLNNSIDIKVKAASALAIAVIQKYC